MCSNSFNLLVLATKDELILKSRYSQTSYKLVKQIKNDVICRVSAVMPKKTNNYAKENKQL